MVGGASSFDRNDNLLLAGELNFRGQKSHLFGLQGEQSDERAASIVATMARTTLTILQKHTEPV